MSAPRRLVPGQTHTVTRRTARRCFFLSPTPRVREVVTYAIGLALTRRPDMRLHALLVEANHTHGCVTDQPDPARPSDLPGFFGDAHSLIARALNADYGRGEALWRSGGYDNVEVHDQASLEAQLVYIWTNTVKDGLVERPEAWPGLRLLPEDFGRTIVARKPAGAFFGGRRPAHVEPEHPAARADWLAELHREEEGALALARQRERRRRMRDELRGLGPRRRRQLARERERRLQRRAERAREARATRPPRVRSRLPDEVTFTVSPPPGYEHLTIEQVRAHFRRLLDAEVARIHAQRRAEGKTTFMGVEAILAQDPRESAGDTFPTFARNPRVACKDRDRRVAVLLGLRAWREEVAEKRRVWRDGDRGAVFPAGVYGLARFHGASVAHGAAVAPGRPGAARRQP